MASEAEIEENPAQLADPQWRESLLGVMRAVVHKLPDTTDLGELVAAMRANPTLVPLLNNMSVQELIDMAVSRPLAPPEPEITYDEEGNPMMDLPDNSPAVIRRRADAPDGDLRILRVLADEGPMTESGLGRATRLTSDQVRLLLRHLRSKGLIHIEGSGTKRRIKVTRNGGNYLRKQSRRR
jgi:DNA-binding transcriptional ArsR family regulator